MVKKNNEAYDFLFNHDNERKMAEILIVSRKSHHPIKTLYEVFTFLFFLINKPMTFVLSAVGFDSLICYTSVRAGK